MVLKKLSSSHLGPVIVMGAVWGVAEVILGAYLHQCASFASGSIMTGVSFFFIAASWAFTESLFGPVLLVSICSVLKMFDAGLLSLPFHHGAVANPIFAFLTEGLAFLLLIAVFKEGRVRKKTHQALWGGLSALVAVNVFPLVKFVTGIPACVFPGTSYPLSLYYAPLAVGISLVTLPFGLLAGIAAARFELKLKNTQRIRRLRGLLSPAAVVLCLLLIMLVRMH